MKKTRISAASRAVTGYHIHAADGEIGHVEDFLVDDAGWRHPLHHGRYQELVARRVGLDFGPRCSTGDRLGGRFNSMSTVRGSKTVPYLESAMTVDRAYEEKHRAYYDYGLPGTLT